MSYFDTPDGPCALCSHAKWEHVIGADEDCDSPECGPHDSFCLTCDEDSDHEWAPVTSMLTLTEHAHVVLAEHGYPVDGTLDEKVRWMREQMPEGTIYLFPSKPGESITIDGRTWTMKL